MKKKQIYIIIGIVLITMLLVLARRLGWLGDNNKAKEVTVEVATKGTIIEIVSSSGKIQPELEVKISPEVSGEIVELPIIEGQDVEKGQLLVRINPDIYLAAVSRTEAAVNASRSALASAKAQLIEADRIYQRTLELKKKGAVSEQELDGAQRGFEVARLAVESTNFQLKSSEANLKEARDNLNRTTIYSPAQGTISLLNVEAGERVVGTAQMAGTELLRVANLENMEVLVQVNENDIVRVHLGDTADIEVDAFLGKTFKGIVTQIANSAKLVTASTDQVTNFEVRVRILKESYINLLEEGKKSPFRPGMTASVDIKTIKKRNIVKVPIQSITLRSDSTQAVKGARKKSTNSKENEMIESEKDDKPENSEIKQEDFEVVFIVNENNTIKLKAVQTGIQDDKFIEIAKGLKEGEKVVTGPYALLSKLLESGDLVKIKPGSSK